MAKDTMIGVDLGKTVFQVHGHPNGQNDRTDLGQKNQFRTLSDTALQ